MIGSSDILRIERVEKLLSESLDRAQTPVAAFVHPDDFLQLGEYLESLELDVRSDASVESGECRVEFPSYDLVSSLSHQMQQIEDGLREVLNNA
jgi:flagellar biosynthesis/type III secretory pathway protein FliH